MGQRYTSLVQNKEGSTSQPYFHYTLVVTTGLMEIFGRVAQTYNAAIQQASGSGKMVGLEGDIRLKVRTRTS